MVNSIFISDLSQLLVHAVGILTSCCSLWVIVPVCLGTERWLTDWPHSGDGKLWPLECVCVQAGQFVLSDIYCIFSYKPCLGVAEILPFERQILYNSHSSKTTSSTPPVFLSISLWMLDFSSWLCNPSVLNHSPLLQSIQFFIFCFISSAVFHTVLGLGRGSR